MLHSLDNCAKFCHLASPLKTSNCHAPGIPLDYPYAWAHEPKPGNILEVFSVAIYPTRKIWGAFLLVLLFLLSLACAPGGQIEGKPVLKIGGIPDQNASRLARRYDGFANYLSQELKVPVEYVLSVNYAAVVTAFTQGDLQVAFFGGLTGVQARLQNPGAQAIARRENDAKFHSKFIVRADLPIESLADVKAQARRALEQLRSAATPAVSPALPDFSRWGPVERTPMRRLPRTVARRMSQA